MGYVRQRLLQSLMLIVAYPVTSSDWVPTGAFSRLDAEWDDYIGAVHSDYDELSISTEKLKESTGNDEDSGYDWNLMASGEVPFIAVLYQPTEAEPNLTEVRPKKACGGILVYADTVVTPCGCVMSFVGRVVDESVVPRTKPRGDFFYDMDAVDTKFNYNNLGVNRIYVTFSQFEFDGSSKDHYLDDDIHHFPSTQECYSKTIPYWTTQGKPKDLDSRKINAILAVLKMVPAISYPTPGQYLPWPPKPITDNDTLYNSVDKQEKVVISGMGFDVKLKSFKFFDENGNPTNFLRRGVNLVLEHCYVNSKQCPFEMKRDKTTCFCALHKNKYELCNGTIGWPVVDVNNSVVGLTVTSRACDKPHGSVLVAVFHSTVANEVAVVAGSWAQLLEQNSKRPPLYREAPWLRKTPLYDYGPVESAEYERQKERRNVGCGSSIKSNFSICILHLITTIISLQAVFMSR